MQSVSSRIWTRITVSISYDDNHYSTGIWNHIIMYKLLVLDRNTWTHITVKIDAFRLEYLKPYDNVKIICIKDSFLTL